MLVACSFTRFKGFDVSGFDTLVIVKNTEIFKSCIPQDGVDTTKEYFIGVRCHFDGQAPDKIEFVYTFWMSSEEDSKQFFGSLLKDSNLPQVVKDQYRNSEETMYVTTDGRIVDRDEWLDIGEAKSEVAIKQLPESTWQTYTIDIESRLEKYKGKTPDGKPMGIVIPIGWGIYKPSLFPSLKDRTLNLNIIIDKNGNVEVEEDYRWEHELPDNPYA